MGKYDYQYLSEDSIKDLLPLFGKVFKKDYPESYLRKKYDTSYMGVEHVCCLAYDNGKPIAFYGSIPFKAHYQGQSCLIVEACDSITLSDYRRKGLHYDLARKSYERMREKGALFVFALHSENTFHSTKKLDWQSAERMRRFHIRIPVLPFAKAFSKINWLKNWYNQKVQKVFDSYEPKEPWFPNPLNAEGWLSYEYSRAFFEYKRFSGSRVIELNGVKIWLKVENIIQIGAVEACSEEALLGMIKALKKLAFRLGVNEILFQTTKGAEIEKQLSNYYEGKESWLIGYLNFSSDIPFTEVKFNFGDLDSF